MGTYRCLFCHAFSIKSSFCQQNCYISRVFSVVTQLVSASNHVNDDGNSRNICCSQFCEFHINKGIEDNIFSNLIELTKMIY